MAGREHHARHPGGASRSEPGKRVLDHDACTCRDGCLSAVAIESRVRGKETCRVRLAARHVARGDDHFESVGDCRVAEHEIDLVPQRARHDAKTVAFAGVTNELVRSRHHGEGSLDQPLIDPGLPFDEAVEQFRGHCAVRPLKRLHKPRPIVEAQIIRVVLLARQREPLVSENTSECVAVLRFVVHQHAVEIEQHGLRHSYRPAARYASSSSSTGWRTATALPAAFRPAPICIWQPGFPVATTCGAAARSRSIFTANTARDISGSSRVNNPALPQHSAAPGTDTSSSSGLAANTLSGGTATPCACSRWQGGSYATCRSSGAPAIGPRVASPANNSVTSRTRAPKRAPASSPRRCPYSFISAPQPALFTTIGSSPLPNAATFTRAIIRALSIRPAWAWRAPQQTWPLISWTW